MNDEEIYEDVIRNTNISRRCGGLTPLEKILMSKAREDERKKGFVKSKWNHCDECKKPVFNDDGVAIEIYRLVHSECDKTPEQARQLRERIFKEIERLRGKGREPVDEPYDDGWNDALDIIEKFLKAKLEGEK